MKVKISPAQSESDNEPPESENALPESESENAPPESENEPSESENAPPESTLHNTPQSKVKQSLHHEISYIEGSQLFPKIAFT